jgi:hypothetical protein
VKAVEFLCSVRRVRESNAIYYHSTNGRGRRILPVGYLKILHDRDHRRPSGVILVILLCACAVYTDDFGAKHPNISSNHSVVWPREVFAAAAKLFHRPSSVPRYHIYRYTVYIPLKYKFKCVCNTCNSYL